MSTSSNAYIKPAWTPITIAIMVFGFIIHPILGLAMIGYIIWGDKLEGVNSDIRKASRNLTEKFGKCHKDKTDFNSHSKTYTTGNSAFDEWREQEIARLQQERERLDREREEFENYMQEVRFSKDKEEFETFRRSRGTTARNKKSGKSTPDV